MADHPIIFSAPMVRALLSGAKTQTRQLAWRWVKDRDERHLSNDDANGTHQPSPWQRVRPGDRLWVREAAWIPPHPDEISESDLRCGADTWEPSYHADGPDPYVEDYRRWDWKSRPSIHMPRWASRITLHVEAVRVERLRDISEGDAIAEGVEMESADPPFYYVPGIYPHSLTAVGVEEPGGRHATRSFAKLWNTLHGPGAWDANPEVVVLQFRVVKGNIDHA